MTEDKNIDRMEIHYRQQLCALMDGDLPPDEARFLLRRLQHDAELGGCWERWQMIGESLRGRAVAPLPADFSQRVALAVAAEPTIAAATRAASGQGPRWARWGGGALAASVALVALFVARQQTPTGTEPQAEPAAPIVASAPARAPEPIAPPAPAAADPQPAATLAAAAVAVAEVPRRAANRRASSRSQSQRAALRARENPPIVAVAAANDVPISTISTPSAAPAEAIASASRDPFASQAIAPSRPWPSATLPQLSGASALSVDFGQNGAYYPFQPRMPVQASPPEGDALQNAEEAPQR